MKYPNKIFFTGVPGSKWSSIAQQLESTGIFNTSDRSKKREYNHNKYSGHKGNYYGKKMEFPAKLNKNNLNAPFKKTKGIKLLKSHEWVFKLDKIKKKFKNDWIMLIYRNSHDSFEWWLDAGGFDITYPSYKSYKNKKYMFWQIKKQNYNILKFASENKLKWYKFDSKFVKKFFKTTLKINNILPNVYVTIYKMRNPQYTNVPSGDPFPV